MKKRFYEPPTLFIKKSDTDRLVLNNLKNKVSSIKLSSEEEMRRLYASDR